MLEIHFKRLAFSQFRPATNQPTRSAGDKLASQLAVNGVSMDEFKAQFGLQLDHNFSLPVTPREFDALVVEVFGVYLRSLAKHAGAFDVHMLFVCGKPSEQPAIREMIERLIPVPIERIQFARGFKAGNWSATTSRMSKAQAAMW